MNNTSILLESGTGEAEILKFKVCGKHYAINVVKVKEILPLRQLTPVPNAPTSVLGITLIRGEVVTVIDLHSVLEGITKEEFDLEHSKILLCEFNQSVVAFLVDEVIGIHRVRWDQMHAPDQMIQGSGVVANIEYEGIIYMLLDFESIVVEISPSMGISPDMVERNFDKKRSRYKLYLADDSKTIRQLIKDTLEAAGYNRLTFFDDGQELYDALLELVERKGKDYIDDIDLVITDIEMPRLDGHTLVRRIKEHEILNKLPIIIFSSLITEKLRHKGESVGADAQLSKPEAAELVNVLDSLLLK